MATAAASTHTSAANWASTMLSGAQHDSEPVIPRLFSSEPPIRDALDTHTSQLQEETVESCLPFLTGYGHDLSNVHGIPRLQRDGHVRFLRTHLGPLPSEYKSADPARPWFFYWCLTGLALLGEDVTQYRSRLIETVRPLQSETGGFAGGFGQTSHLATTYATVLSLALVGGAEAYEIINRRTMWKWLSSLKQPDGGFQMAVGGEEDVRGAYCASVIISLLNIPRTLSPDSPARNAGHTDLFSSLARWIGKCQTYEGGVSAAPGHEAHGAYAFCALGCLAILDSPERIIPGCLDLPRLVSWLSSRQNAPEGGFSGRTNKLVDGCYSHWVGGCWPLIEASFGGAQRRTVDHQHTQPIDSLFSRDGLIRYILCCCQDLRRGGLRDKPDKSADAYHTCYVLAGLSSVQHHWTVVSNRADAALAEGDKWSAIPYGSAEDQIFHEADRIGTLHPVYAIPQHSVDDCQQYFARKLGF